MTLVEHQPISLFKFPDDETKEFWTENFKYVSDNYFVSNLKASELEKLLSFFDSKEKYHCFLAIANVPEEFENQNLHLHSCFDGKVQICAGVEIFRMKGQYLRICCAYNDKKSEKEIRQLIEQGVNKIKLQYGLAAAYEKVHQEIYSLCDGSYSRTSEGFACHTVGDGREGSLTYLNSFNGGYQAISALELKAEASDLMTQAFQINDSGKCFLFLWIALEIQIGNGQKRREFCEEKLQSEIISGEMKRLHDVRSDYLHEFKHNEDTQGNLVSIIELIKLSTIKEENEQIKYAQFLEKEFFSTSS